MAILLTLNLILSLTSDSAHAVWPEDRLGCPIPARQALQPATRLIVVKVEHDRAMDGEMELWERVNRTGSKKDFRQNWRLVKQKIPVSIGRRGLAWGYQYRNQDADPRTHKREGDRRTPEGLFALGDIFGSSTAIAPGFMSLTQHTHCVDDANSKYYNQMVEVKDGKVEAIWARTKQPFNEQGSEIFTSSEVMHQNPDYAIGVNINYVSNAAAKAGSCIFLHTRKLPTTGCVSMSTEEMINVANWLGAQRGAILISAKNRLERWNTCWR